MSVRVVSRSLVAVALAASIVVGSVGCSAFQPKMQQVTINTVPSGANVAVDGTSYGRSPVTVPLQRNKSHSIVATLGSQSGVRDLNTHLSSTGILDIVGTALFLIPGIGLFTPGAFDVQSNVAVQLR